MELKKLDHSSVYTSNCHDGALIYKRFQGTIFNTVPDTYRDYTVQSLNISYPRVYKKLTKMPRLFEKISEIRSNCKQALASSFWKTGKEYLVIGNDGYGSTIFYIYSNSTRDAKNLTRYFYNNWITSEQRLDYINADFVSWAGNDVYYSPRQIQTSPLLQIENNYNNLVITQVKNLISLESPDQLGKIVFWHGPPGTGKTYLLRSLLQHWHHQLNASIEIILDPETFFSHAQYMQHFLSRQVPINTLRILVMEDAGCHLDISARQTSGFSRLLNLTDGLLGQGQRLVCVFTANERVDQIDPAILRAGRCLQQLEITPLSLPEAKNWLEIKKVKVVEPLKDTSLANLYDLCKQNYLSREFSPKKLGF